MALGASSKSICALIFSESIAVVLSGIIIGVPLAWAAAQLLTNFLYGIIPADPQVIITATAVLLGASIAAALLPARRAARVDPMAALRNE
jgi:ABC-type antimicrobial peptide transport system permease subunit